MKPMKEIAEPDRKIYLTEKPDVVIFEDYNKGFLQKILLQIQLIFVIKIILLRS